MKILNRNLVVALILQVVLFFIILLSTQKTAEQESSSLLDFEITNINGVSIKNQENEVNVSKEDDIWLQKDFQSFHVPGSKVEDLLSTLANTRIGFPIASSTEAAKRFKVTEDTAETIITLKQNKKPLETLYIGSGSGLRTVHARMQNDDKIYSIELSMNQISSDKNDWIDTSILRAKGEVQEIKTKEFNVQLKNNTWQADFDIPEGQQLNQKVIADWVKQFKSLDVAAFIEPDTAKEITIQNPTATFSIKSLLKGEVQSIDYAFYKDNDKHYVKRFGESNVFSVLNYKAENLLKTKIEDFLVDAPALPDEEKQDLLIDDTPTLTGEEKDIQANPSSTTDSNTLPKEG